VPILHHCYSLSEVEIHLLYDVYFMEHTDCQAVKLLVFVASASIYWYCLFDFFSFYFFFIVKLSYSLYAVFLCYLMAFDCQELKGLLTYLFHGKTILM